MRAGAKLGLAVLACAAAATAAYFLVVAPPAAQAPPGAGPGGNAPVAAGPCDKVLKCAAPRSLQDASEACREPIAQLAVFQPRWLAAAGEPIFTDYAWLVEAQGSIRYFGNRAEFGNASGAFAPVNYECDFDPLGRKVLDVRVRGGA